jgi:pSer/pThr/pTyr-binding forkhead associated (FHA) protein
MELLILIFSLLVLLGALAAVVVWAGPKLMEERLNPHLARMRRGACAEVAVLGTSNARRYPLPADGQIVIGRGSTCDIVLDEVQISRNHAAIRCDGKHFTVQDLGSQNGIVIDGKRVDRGELAFGAQFMVGRTTLVLLKPDAPMPSLRASGNKTTSKPSDPSRTLPSALPAPPDYVVDEASSASRRAAAYRARKRSTGEAVTIKFLTHLHDSVSGAQLRQQLEHQIRLGATIQHPHCVRVLDGNANFDPPYLVEELVTGGTLAARVKRGRLSHAEAVRVIGQVCDALDYLHRNGIVHGHLSMHSILFDGEGKARINDIGLPRLTGVKTTEQLIALFDDMAYLSPEHLRGDLSEVGPHSDQYALATIAHELFTGRPPFVGSEASVREQHLRTKPRPPIALSASLPKSINSAILRALEKHPARRHASLFEMAQACGYLLGEQV